MFKGLNAVGLASRESCAAAIGTLAIETASTFLPVEEAYWLSPMARMAYYADTSKHAYYGSYWGRGLIQLTLESNYRKYSELLEIDLLGFPELALNLGVSVKIFVEYWKQRAIASVADLHDWREVRRRVQGADAGLNLFLQITED